MNVINAQTKICIIIGDPVEHSLSPIMHNTAYRALHIDNQFVFLASRVSIEDVEQIVKAVRIMGIRGLTCTIPHKLEVMKYIDKIDPIAQKIGAVNTVVNDNGVLTGYNTDWIGAVVPLENSLGKNGLIDKNVALIGAGGASRAIAYGVIERGAKLTIYNRTIETAKILANELGAEFASLDQIADVKNANIIINSTNIGMGSLANETPVPDKFINRDQVIFDAVYVPFETLFLKEARAKGATIIHGIEMLLHQGTAQFEYYTNHPAPLETMKTVLYNHFNIHEIQKNKINIAIPIQVNGSIQSIKKRVVQAVASGADIIEFRLDYWRINKQIDDIFLKLLRNITPIPVILTVRSAQEGGKSILTDVERISLLRRAVEHNFDFVDIELSTLVKHNIDVKDFKKDSSTKIIVSYHNFSTGDDLSTLQNIKDQMIKKGADICKIVVTSQGEETNNVIFNLIKSNKQVGHVIVGIAMGETGVSTRIKGPSLGSHFTFVTVDKQGNTAPGQLYICD